MCAPCKVILNSGMSAAKLQAFLDAKKELRERGYDFAESTYHRAVEIICPFDVAMDELLELAENGPHVPYERRIIPSRSRVVKPAQQATKRSNRKR